MPEERILPSLDVSPGGGRRAGQRQNVLRTGRPGEESEGVEPGAAGGRHRALLVGQTAEIGVSLRGDRVSAAVDGRRDNYDQNERVERAASRCSAGFKV